MALHVTISTMPCESEFLDCTLERHDSGPSQGSICLPPKATPLGLHCIMRRGRVKQETHKLVWTVRRYWTMLRRARCRLRPPEYPDYIYESRIDGHGQTHFPGIPEGELKDDDGCFDHPPLIIIYLTTLSRRLPASHAYAGNRL